MNDGDRALGPLRPARDRSIDVREPVDLRTSARAAMLAVAAFVGVMHVLPMLLEVARQAAR